MPVQSWKAVSYIRINAARNCLSTNCRDGRRILRTRSNTSSWPNACVPLLKEKRLFHRLSPTRFSGNRFLYVSSSGRSFFIFRYSVYTPGMFYPSAISRGHRAARFFSISAAKVHRTFTPDNEPRCFFLAGRPVKIFAPYRNFSKKTNGNPCAGEIGATRLSTIKIRCRLAS